MWFDKEDERGLFVDRRSEVVKAVQHSRKNPSIITIDPDIIADFQDLPFPNETFQLVVMDPPHLSESRAGNGNIRKRYGCLFPGWEEEFREGFKECFRVLKRSGVLIFKWCEAEIPVTRILSLTNEKPLFGHKTGKRQKTHWIAFIKP